ncbi:MAG: nitroreductase family protein [Promethearchaeota archaeon]|nr:MAG: nitroreductase family protein [Candidatus Lokiarchaeota archaeon]
MNSMKENNSILDVIKSRHSVRKFTDDPVSEEDLNAVLEAARLAPSGTNKQPWHFIIIKNKETQKKLADLLPWGRYIKNAPIAIAILVKLKSMWSILDGAIAVTHITLEAAARGLGTCWCACYPNIEKRADLEQNINTILGIPEKLRSKMKLITITPLGYPAENGIKETSRKDLSEIVHYEKF